MRFITQLPYSIELGERLRDQSVASSRPVWLRLNGGEQELFAQWPEQTISLMDGELLTLDKDGSTIGRNPPNALWSLIRKGLTRTDATSSAIYKGGWIGLIGYGASNKPKPQQTGLPFPDVMLGDYRRVVIIDHRRKTAEIVTLFGYSGPVDDWLVPVGKCERGHSCQPFRLTQPFVALTPKERYMADFARIQSYLHAGDCYQVNYAQAFRASCKGSGADAMSQLLSVTRAPYAAWILAPEGEVLSLSPELFLSIRNGKVVTKPIKGTAPRSEDPQTDANNRAALGISPKNLSENLMIVDLLRHDLSRHAATGSVRVEKLFEVETLPQVHHLVSTVTATIANGADAIDMIRDSFPGGSITGAPKKRAMEIIAELEPTPRSVYCGAIGVIGADGNAELNIAIRTLLRLGDDIYAWAGGGIVADSNAESEYQECFDKMGALMRTLETHN